MPRLVQGIDLPAEGAACGDGLGWRPLSGCSCRNACSGLAPGSARQALGPLAPCTSPPLLSLPTLPLREATCARGPLPVDVDLPGARLPSRASPWSPPTCRSPNRQRLLLGTDGQCGGLRASATGRPRAEQQQPEEQQRGRRGREARHDAEQTAGEAGGRREQERE